MTPFFQQVVRVLHRLNITYGDGAYSLVGLSDGDIGKYQGGVEMKRTLLQREGVKFISDARVDMSDSHY